MSDSSKKRDRDRKNRKPDHELFERYRSGGQPVFQVRPLPERVPVIRGAGYGVRLAAGTFAHTHHNMSRKVGEKKAKNIRDTGAQMVVTSCPSCTMQIVGLLAHEGLQVEIVHPVELLDRAYRKKEMADSRFEAVGLT